MLHVSWSKEDEEVDAMALGIENEWKMESMEKMVRIGSIEEDIMELIMGK